MAHRPVATVLALTAGAVVLSSGGAVAGSLITGAQIKDGTVTTADVRNRSLVAGDLSVPTVRSFTARGPRGFGRVASNGTVVQKSPGVTVTKPTTGVYCITVPGVAPASAVVVATPYYDTGSTVYGSNGTQSFVETTSGSGDCPASALAVRTFVRRYVPGPDGLASTNLTVEDQPFMFLVP